MQQIILNLAKLPEKHQLWLFKQLPDHLRKKLIMRHGKQLLEHSSAFKKLTKNLPFLNKPPIEAITPPELSKKLESCSALLIAIILYEGRFSWTESFLHQHSKKETIEHLIAHKVLDIKAKTRKMVYQVWMQQHQTHNEPEVSYG